MSKLGFAAAFGASQSKSALHSNAGIWGPGGIQLSLSEDFPYTSSAKALSSYRGWIYNAVSTISNDVAALEVRVVTVHANRTESRVFEHPMYDLLDRPNDYMRGNQLRQMASLHLDLAGEAFFYIPRAVRGLPSAIHLLQPDRVYIVPDPESYIQGYLYASPAGGQLAFLPEEVIHVKYASPDDLYRGYSPVRALGFVPQMNDALRAYLSTYLRNSARPGGVLTTEQALTEDQKKAVKALWNEVHSGSGGSGQIAVLSNGTKYQPVSDGIGALQVGELGNFGADEVLAAYNVPRAKLGLMADANRANADAADYTYRSNVLKPRAAVWQEQLYQPLLEMFRAASSLRARVENPVPTDIERRDKQAALLWSTGAITQKQYLTRIEAPEAENAEDVYQVPPNVIMVSDLLDRADQQASAADAMLKSQLANAGKAEKAPPLTPEQQKLVPETADTPAEPTKGTPVAPEGPDAPIKRGEKARLRSLFARMYAERKSGTDERARDVDRLAELLGDPISAAALLLHIDHQVRLNGLHPTFEVLKSNRATGPLAALLEGSA